MSDRQQLSNDADHDKPKPEQAEASVEQDGGDFLRQGIGLAMTGQGGDDGGDPTQNQATKLRDERLPIQMRRNMAASIGRTRGNHYLQRMMTKPEQTPLSGMVQRAPMTIDEIIDSKDSDNVDFATLPVITVAPLDKRALCIQMVHSNSWVGPEDEMVLESIWNSFGPKGIESYFSLFQQSVNYGVDYERIEFFHTMKREFQTATRSKAGGYLKSNLELAKKEMAQLGIPETEGQGQNADLSAENEKKMKDIQDAAALVGDAMKAKKHLEELQVGFTTRGGAHKVYYRKPGESASRFVWRQYFRDGPPEMSTLPDGAQVNGPKTFPYSEVKGHYDAVNGIIEGYSAKYPGLYTLALGGQLEELVKKDSPQQVQTMMGEGLRTLVANIQKAQPMISSGDLDHLELLPIHAQLTNSDPKWSTQIGRWFVKQEVEGHEDAEFWQSLGLGTLAAVAFVVAELATFGTATFWIAAAAGAGASGLQAGMSIEKYMDMDTASKAAVSPSSQLVYEGQVSAAALAAVLDTVFAFLDLAGPAMRGLRAARLGRATSVMDVIPVDKVIKEIGQGAEKELIGKLPTVAATQEGRDILEKSVAQLGVERTKELSGKTYKELVEIAGQKSATGERIKDFMSRTPLTPEEIKMYKGDLKLIGEDVRMGWLPVDKADALILMMIEQIGPMEVVKRAGGWKALNASTILGKGTKAGKAMEAWRQSLVKELDDFMERQFQGKVKATGTPGSTHDLDVSQLGKQGEGGVPGVDAAKHREAAVSYLAGKLGVDPGELNKLLDTDLFIDPRRIHLYDEVFEKLPLLREKVAKQAAALEQELIMNFRLAQAEKLNDPALVKQIKKEMEAMGIPQTRVPLPSPEGVGMLNQEAEQLMSALETAVKQGDLGAQERLVLEIAQKQAMINAAEKGGYFSGGGVRAMASERDAFPGYHPYKDPKTGQIIGEVAGKPMLKSQLLAASLDQLAKLDKFASQFLMGKAKDLPDALKNIGKYGQRFSELVQRAGMTIPGDVAGVFDGLAGKFEKILKNSGDLSPNLAIRQQQVNALADEARAALGNLEKSHLALLQQLQKEADLLNVPGGLEALASATQARALARQAKESTMQLVYQAARVLGVPIAEIFDKDPDGAGEAPQPTPPPNPEDARKSVDDANQYGKP